MNAQQTELSYTQMNTITTAMAKKGHTAGRVRYSRTLGGKLYAYVMCINTYTVVTHHGATTIPNSKCGTEVEYSLDRDKLTKSTIQYKCGGG